MKRILRILFSLLLIFSLSLSVCAAAEAEDPAATYDSFPWNTLLLILMIPVGLWHAISPRTAWYVSTGKWNPDAEFTDKVKNTYRICGIVCVIIAILLLILR